MRSPLFCLPAKLTFHALLLKTVFVLAFLVIVPLCNPKGNLWNLIGEITTEPIQDNTVSQTPIPLLSVCDD